MAPKKKIFFVQLVMMAPDAAEPTPLGANIVQLLEAGGYEPSLINIEHVTSRERYDEIEERMKALKSANDKETTH